MLNGKKLIVHRMAVAEPASLSPGSAATPGEARVEQHRLLVCCAKGTWLELFEVQLEGKKRLPAAEFLRGMQLASGARLG